MPKPKKPRAKRGDTRLPASRPALARLTLTRTPHRGTHGAQLRGGRPPRFPGRTGGR